MNMAYQILCLEPLTYDLPEKCPEIQVKIYVWDVYLYI